MSGGQHKSLHGFGPYLCHAPKPALRSYGYDMLFEYKKMWGQMFWMGVPFEQDPTGECARATVQ